MGGSKLSLALGGRPLITYPIAAMKAVVRDVAVIAKADVDLPPLERVMLWIEPDEPRGPLTGLVEALVLAGGRPVLVCPADMPLVTPSLLVKLSQTPPGDAPAVIAASGGRPQPLLGCYQPDAARLLAAAARRSEAQPGPAVMALGPRLLEVDDPRELFDVDSPEDLLIAASLLNQPNVKS